MSAFLHNLSLAAPLYILVLIGYAVACWRKWPRSISNLLSRFVFNIALPAFLFTMMSDFSKLPPVDARLLIAYFGGCLIVFILGRVVGLSLFRLDGVSQSVFALGGVFSNNVLLGVPLAKSMLGDTALPSVALILVFNALTLWTLVTISVEWARHGSFSVTGFAKTARSVLTNPIVASILSGALFGMLGWPLPVLIQAPLSMLGQIAAPLSLVVVGMGLADYGIREGWTQSLAICLLKLVLLPFAVWVLASVLALPILETQVIVLLSSLSVGVNVYLMSRQFNTMEAPVATSMLLSTALSCVTAPLILSLTGS
ncbi:MAG: AEC family transporter [Proteobacteria bacterium]|nr:AEC family transporter [Pseudomonadota bacterium]